MSDASTRPAASAPTVVIAPDGALPGWAAGLDGAVTLAPEAPDLADALADAGCVLIDAAVNAPLTVARRARTLAPPVQVILVASRERSGELERALLFTPGLGEPWVAAPEETGRDLVRRATEITRQRRVHARTLDRVSGVTAMVHRTGDLSRRLSDQYLATVLEMLPEPVLALDEDDSILFVNPEGAAVFGIDVTGSPAGLADRLRPADPAELQALLDRGDQGVARGQLRLRGGASGERIYDAVVARVPSERPVRALVLHDVTERVHAQDALAELAAEQTAVLGNLAEGVIIVGMDERIYFVNDAAARIHGVEHLSVPVAEWAEKYNLRTLDGEPYPADQLPLARALREGQTVREAEWLVRRPDGSLVHAQGSAAPVVDHRGRMRGAVLTVRDVTDQRHREAERDRLLQERDEALAELKEVMHHRSRFYASMSHELRTPINAIIGYNDLLTDGIYGPVPDAQRAALDRSRRAAGHLLDLVNDVLDLSKLEAGKLAVELEPVNVKALIRDLEATMAPLARTRDVRLTFHFDEHCDRSLRTDPRRLGQIMLNLLSNAIRFGAGSPVDVRCFRGPDGGGVRIEVQDRGPGVDPDRLADIFDEFVQLGDAEEGTGLGLPIARALARTLGGDVTVESTPGAGSTFTVALPEIPPKPGA
jgi:PAS domain S-box-containing protein